MTPSDLETRIDKAASLIRDRLGKRRPGVGLILGSGLGSFASRLDDALAIPYAEIPGFPVSTVAGHAGRLVAGTVGGSECLVMQGRVHYYEGHDLDLVVLPARVLVSLGCKVLVVTNAAGGIRRDLAPGDLVLLVDHLNLMGANPLRGPNPDFLGPRFPDMSTAYDPELRKLARRVARASDVDLKTGVYAALQGPTYETPAEIRMLAALGADLVGMSTVPEVIAAHHMGARVLGMSCVTNLAAGISPTKLSHEEVAETASRVEKTFVGFVSALVPELARDKE
ncbi:MAG: purine-nucleoside phosphorylase [Polyangia bacterium]|jgi:purine-nucleoside phosphorylase|nr:purine-nucleoside phosphorylase [Polyangia bacterium]